MVERNPQAICEVLDKKDRLCIKVVRCKRDDCNCARSVECYDEYHHAIGRLTVWWWLRRSATGLRFLATL